MRARIAIATVMLVVSAGLSAAADELESIRIPVPRGNVTAYPIPGLEPWIVVRTQGSPETTGQLKGGPPGPKSTKTVVMRKELDQKIARIVYTAVVTGTQLWDMENYEATYWLYYGTLVAVLPMIDQYPKLTAQAEDALRRSVKMRPTDGAFALREALDAIQKETSVSLTPTALWDRLGGEKVFRELVKDFLATTVKDKQTPLTRGKFKPEGKDLERLEQAVVEAISEQTGGPLKPTEGMGLKDVLAGTKITQLEFIGLETNLTIAARKHKISPAELKELVTAFYKLREQIVGQ